MECDGLQYILSTEAIELTQLHSISTGKTRQALIARTATRKLAKQLGVNFVVLTFCPACGLATIDGTPDCVRQTAADEPAAVVR